MKLNNILRILLVFANLSIYGQGINNIWLQGYASAGGLPYGITTFDFNTGNPTINYDSLEMQFNHTHANISDSAGNLLFYTNGYYIADATNDTMQNGGGINPGAYANMFPDGFLIPQAALIIPKPGSSTIYYLFHNTADAYPIIPNNSTSFKFYVSTIDMSLNGGLGAVTTKNVILLTDSMNVGKIAACKHANGRDWWIIIHRVNSNKFFKFLITPTLILGPYSQNIGLIRSDDAGQAKFSPDGKKFAYYHYFNGLDIMDFNRCNGTFSNVVSDVSLPYIQGNVGCEFSPNSQFLYVSNILKVYQYDLSVSNIVNSRMEVAVWDSFIQPGSSSLGVYLCLSQLAPDGKIYITSGNSTTYYGRIESPDSLGLACNVAQHNVLLPTYNFNTLPNHPNYFLGCDTLLGCGCLVNLTPSPSPKERGVRAAPNPTSGAFTLQFNVMGIAGTLEIVDVMGHLVKKEGVAPWSQFKKVDISNLAVGIYVCRVKRGDGVEMVKVIKE